MYFSLNDITTFLFLWKFYPMLGTISRGGITTTSSTKMKSVVLSGLENGRCLQYGNWAKAEDHLVQHNLEMNTVVSQRFLILASFANDWRSASHIDYGVYKYIWENQQIRKWRVWTARGHLHSSMFFHTATSSSQCLLPNLTQLEQVQSLKIWELKHSEPGNTQSIEMNLNNFLRILAFWTWDVLKV